MNGRIADIYTVNIYNRHEALSATLDRTKITAHEKDDYFTAFDFIPITRRYVGRRIYTIMEKG